MLLILPFSFSLFNIVYALTTIMPWYYICISVVLWMFLLHGVFLRLIWGEFFLNRSIICLDDAEPTQLLNDYCTTFNSACMRLRLCLWNSTSDQSDWNDYFFLFCCVYLFNLSIPHRHTLTKQHKSKTIRVICLCDCRLTEDCSVYNNRSARGLSIWQHVCSAGYLPCPAGRAMKLLLKQVRMNEKNGYDTIEAKNKKHTIHQLLSMTYGSFVGARHSVTILKSIFNILPSGLEVFENS